MGELEGSSTTTQCHIPSQGPTRCVLPPNEQSQSYMEKRAILAESLSEYIDDHKASLADVCGNIQVLDATRESASNSTALRFSVPLGSLTAREGGSRDAEFFVAEIDLSSFQTKTKYFVLSSAGLFLGATLILVILLGNAVGTRHEYE